MPNVTLCQIVAFGYQVMIKIDFRILKIYFESLKLETCTV